MRRLLIMCVAVAAFLVAGVSLARAEVVRDPALGLTLTLAPEFVPRPDLVGLMPDVTHVYEYGKTPEGKPSILLMIEKMRGTIGRERLRAQDMPAGFAGSLFVAQWQGFDVDGIEVPETIQGIPCVTYNVQVPLKPQAIQLKLFGPADKVETLKPLLKEVLGNLKGETNWLSSIAPPTVAKAPDYGVSLLWVGIVAVVLGLVGLWVLSRYSPKGTVLALAVLLYALSYVIGDVHVREVRLLSGATRMLGFFGIFIGVFDLVRRRQAVAGPDEPVVAESPSE